MRSKLGRFLCVNLLLINASVKSDELDVYALSLEDLLTIKIATSTLTDKNISDIPAPLTVFSRSDIDSIGVRYLHELLEYVPGYQVTRYANYPYEYSASSRALTFGASSKKILFLLNGHKINGPRSGNAAHLANFALAHVERVEVIRGPGSSIYGSNAFTGVINIVTRDDSDRLTIASGNQITHDAFVMYTMAIANYSVNAQLNSIASRGENYLVSDTFSSDQITIGDPFDQMTLQLSAKSDAHNMTLHYREINMDDFYHTSRISNEHNYSKHSALLFLNEYTFSLFDDINSRLQFDYVQTYMENGNQSTPIGIFNGISEPNSLEPLYGKGIFEDFRVAIALHNNWQLTQQTDVQFGLEWQINKEQRADGYTNYDLAAFLNREFPITYFPSGDNQTKIGGEQSQPFIGGYAQLQTTQGKVNWIVGGRFDRYPDLKTQFSPRLGAIYFPNNEWQLKLLYGEAFRAPELSELTLFRGVSRTGNQNLESESLRTTDLIFQYTGNNLLLSIDFFYNHFSDPIVAGLINDLSGQVNGQDQYGHGVESEMVWQVNNASQLRLTATQFTKLPGSAFRDSKTLASIQATHQLGNWQLGLSASYRSKRETPTPNDERTTLAGYWYWRTAIAYAVSKQVKISLNINNLANQHYYNPSITANLSEGIPLKGINGTLGISWQF